MTTEDRWARLREWAKTVRQDDVLALVLDLLVERDALAMELEGYKKAYALMQTSYGELCEERDRLKHERRALLEERDDREIRARGAEVQRDRLIRYIELLAGSNCDVLLTDGDTTCTIRYWASQVLYGIPDHTEEPTR